jgi:hypothetical protein
VSQGRILIKSDGTPWRPVIHVEDICRAFCAVLAAPREQVHNQVFNVGRTDENYRVSELAEMVAAEVPDCRIEYAPGGGPDKRSYRVDCDKISRVVPGFRRGGRFRRSAAVARRVHSIPARRCAVERPPVSSAGDVAPSARCGQRRRRTALATRMIFIPTDIRDTWLIDIEPIDDERGFFARSFCRRSSRGTVCRSRSRRRVSC